MSELGSRMKDGPRPEFRAGLRERLVNASAGAEEPRPFAERSVPGRHRHRRRAAPAWRHTRPGVLSRLLSAALAVAMVAAGLATYRSMPGDTLYPLKRAAESTMVRLSTDEAERADRSFGYAETRAHEVEELLGSTRREKIKETLEDMEDTTRVAVSSLTRIRRRDGNRNAGQLKSFVQKQRHQIEGMLPKLDVEDARRASGYLNYIIGLAPPE